MFTGNCSATLSKHRDRPYRGGRQKYWIKVKKRKHPAMDRVAEFVSLGLARIKGGPSFLTGTKSWEESPRQ
jgi:ATP-dependent DNA ligase